MARWVERLSNTPQLNKGELAIMLVKLEIGIARKKAEKLAKAKNFLQCAGIYMKLVNKYPKHRRRGEMLYNAALCYEGAKRIDRAIAVRKNLITSVPMDPLVLRTLRMLADNLQVKKKYGEAARAHERLAHAYPQYREAPNSLVRAFLLHVEGKKLKRARKNAIAFLKLYKKRLRFSAERTCFEHIKAQAFRKDWRKHCGPIFGR